LDLTTHTSLSPIRRGFAPGFVNYKKGALDSQPQVIKLISCLLMEIKRRARKDKRNYLEERAEEAEKAAARGDLNTVYKITKELCGQSKQPPPVKDKSGNIISTEREQATRWVEHFRAVLNRPEPTIAFKGRPQLEDLDISTDPPSEEEIMKAIKSMKSGKAAGIDGIQAELLKVDIHTATVTLHGLFKDIWEENKIPEDWAKGLIVKLNLISISYHCLLHVPLLYKFKLNQKFY